MIYDPDGIDREKLAFVMDLKNVRRGRIKEYADKFKGAKYVPADASSDPLWDIKADCAFPSATQNEINAKDAANLLKNGVHRGLRRRQHADARSKAAKLFLDAKILYGPAKAANAGGVATSGLEMSQNSMRLGWTREEVDERLHKIMIAHPQELLRDRGEVRHAGQPGERREHRRLPQGRQRDAGPGLV